MRAVGTRGFRPMARTLAIRANRDYATVLLVIQWLCAMALLVPAFGRGRMVVRMLSMGASLALLFLIPAVRRQRHPAARFGVAALVIVILSVFHPTTNSVLSGTAQAAMYAAVLAPLFWVPRMDVDAT